MFDYVRNPRGVLPPRRWYTTVLSAIGHVAVVVALAIPALYATDTLPPPEETLAFFVSAPPPPPPPPPAPAPAAPKPEPKVARETPKPAPARPVAPTPVEAPSAITPETGLEGIATAENVIEPGFEGGVPGGVIGGVIGGIENAPPPPPPPAPVRVGGAITAPRLVKRVEPVYPPLALAAMAEGTVILEATVDREGQVDEVRVLRSHPLLDEAAMTAVRQWRYEPLMLNGQPQPFILTVTVSFSVPTM